MLKKELARVPSQKTFQRVEFGSLVSTDKERYFISIGLGKVDIEGETYYVISLASPMGNVLKDKVVGDSIAFQGRTIIIKSIT